MGNGRSAIGIVGVGIGARPCTGIHYRSPSPIHVILEGGDCGRESRCGGRSNGYGRRLSVITESIGDGSPCIGHLNDVPGGVGGGSGRQAVLHRGGGEPGIRPPCLVAGGGGIACRTVVVVIDIAVPKRRTGRSVLVGKAHA